MSKAISVDEARRILQSGNFDELIGVIEDENIEFKAAPYQVERDSGKMELAKDVSALGNADCGLIVMGVQTEKNPSVQGDEARSIRTFPSSLIDRDRYAKIIREWIYPPIPGLTVDWHPSSSQPDRGLVSIWVPKGAADEKPYVVNRSVDDTGKIVGYLVGYFERARSDVNSLSPQRLRDRLKDGLRFSDITIQLQSIQAAISEAAPAPSKTPVISDTEVNARIIKARIASGINGGPTFYLAAYAPGGTTFPTLFKSPDTEVVQLLESPPRLRPSGFDLGRTNSTIVAGKLRRAITKRRKLLELWKDGFLGFVSAADDSFLGWAMQSTAETGQRINNIALGESTYLFCDLAIKVYGYADPKPEAVNFELGLLDMTVDGRASSLSTYYPSQFTVGDGFEPAPGKNGVFRAVIALGKVETGVIAYELLRQVYSWFGFDESSIPYVVSDAAPSRIDPMAFRSR